MKSIRRVVAATTTAATVALINASTVFAQGGTITPGGDAGRLAGINITRFISTLIQLIFVIAGVLALIYLIWGGLRWIMSGGDKAATQSAREQITAAVIGLAIVFLSFAIINVIGQFFGINILNITIPSIT